MRLKPLTEKIVANWSESCRMEKAQPCGEVKMRLLMR